MPSFRFVASESFIFLKFRVREAESFHPLLQRGLKVPAQVFSFFIFLIQVSCRQLTVPTQTSSVCFTAADQGAEVLFDIFFKFISFRCQSRWSFPYRLSSREKKKFTIFYLYCLSDYLNVCTVNSTHPSAPPQHFKTNARKCYSGFLLFSFVLI